MRGDYVEIIYPRLMDGEGTAVENCGTYCLRFRNCLIISYKSFVAVSLGIDIDKEDIFTFSREACRKRNA
jgi:hypothetical protein